MQRISFGVFVLLLVACSVPQSSQLELHQQYGTTQTTTSENTRTPIVDATPLAPITTQARLDRESHPQIELHPDEPTKDAAAVRHLRGRRRTAASSETAAAAIDESIQFMNPADHTRTAPATKRVDAKLNSDHKAANSDIQFMDFNSKPAKPASEVSSTSTKHHPQGGLASIAHSGEKRDPNKSLSSSIQFMDTGGSQAAVAKPGSERRQRAVTLPIGAPHPADSPTLTLATAAHSSTDTTSLPKQVSAPVHDTAGMNTESTHAHQAHSTPAIPAVPHATSTTPGILPAPTLSVGDAARGAGAGAGAFDLQSPRPVYQQYSTGEHILPAPLPPAAVSGVISASGTTSSSPLTTNTASRAATGAMAGAVPSAAVGFNSLGVGAGVGVGVGAPVQNPVPPAVPVGSTISSSPLCSTPSCTSLATADATTTTAAAAVVPVAGAVNGATQSGGVGQIVFMDPRSAVMSDLQQQGFGSVSHKKQQQKQQAVHQLQSFQAAPLDVGIGTQPQPHAQTESPLQGQSSAMVPTTQQQHPLRPQTQPAQTSATPMAVPQRQQVTAHSKPTLASTSTLLAPGSASSGASAGAKSPVVVAPTAVQRPQSVGARAGARTAGNTGKMPESAMDLTSSKTPVLHSTGTPAVQAFPAAPVALQSSAATQDEGVSVETKGVSQEKEKVKQKESRKKMELDRGKERETGTENEQMKVEQQATQDAAEAGVEFMDLSPPSTLISSTTSVPSTSLSTSSTATPTTTSSSSSSSSSFPPPPQEPPTTSRTATDAAAPVAALMPVSTAAVIRERKDTIATALPVKPAAKSGAVQFLEMNPALTTVNPLSPTRVAHASPEGVSRNAAVPNGEPGAVSFMDLNPAQQKPRTGSHPAQLKTAPAVATAEDTPPQTFTSAVAVSKVVGTGVDSGEGLSKSVGVGASDAGGAGVAADEGVTLVRGGSQPVLTDKGEQEDMVGKKQEQKSAKSKEQVQFLDLSGAATKTTLKSKSERQPKSTTAPVTQAASASGSSLPLDQKNAKAVPAADVQFMDLGDQPKKDQHIETRSKSEKVGKSNPAATVEFMDLGSIEGKEAKKKTKDKPLTLTASSAISSAFEFLDLAASAYSKSTKSRNAAASTSTSIPPPTNSVTSSSSPYLPLSPSPTQRRLRHTADGAEVDGSITNEEHRRLAAPASAGAGDSHLQFLDPSSLPLPSPRSLPTSTSISTSRVLGSRSSSAALDPYTPPLMTAAPTSTTASKTPSESAPAVFVVGTTSGSGGDGSARSESSAGLQFMDPASLSAALKPQSSGAQQALPPSVVTADAAPAATGAGTGAAAVKGGTDAGIQFLDTSTLSSTSSSSSPVSAVAHSVPGSITSTSPITSTTIAAPPVSLSATGGGGDSTGGSIVRALDAFMPYLPTNTNPVVSGLSSDETAETLPSSSSSSTVTHTAPSAISAPMRSGTGGSAGGGGLEAFVVPPVASVPNSLAITIPATTAPAATTAAVSGASGPVGENTEEGDATGTAGTEEGAVRTEEEISSTDSSFLTVSQPPPLPAASPSSPASNMLHQQQLQQPSVEGISTTIGTGTGTSASGSGALSMTGGSNKDRGTNNNDDLRGEGENAVGKTPAMYQKINARKSSNGVGAEVPMSATNPLILATTLPPAGSSTSTTTSSALPAAISSGTGESVSTGQGSTYTESSSEGGAEGLAEGTESAASLFAPAPANPATPPEYVTPVSATTFAGDPTATTAFTTNPANPTTTAAVSTDTVGTTASTPAAAVGDRGTGAGVGTGADNGQALAFFVPPATTHTTTTTAAAAAAPSSTATTIHKNNKNAANSLQQPQLQSLSQTQEQLESPESSAQIATYTPPLATSAATTVTAATADSPAAIAVTPGLVATTTATMGSTNANSANMALGLKPTAAYATTTDPAAAATAAATAASQQAGHVPVGTGFGAELVGGRGSTDSAAVAGVGVGAEPGAGAAVTQGEQNDFNFDGDSNSNSNSNGNSADTAAVALSFPATTTAAGQDAAAGKDTVAGTGAGVGTAAYDSSTGLQFLDTTSFTSSSPSSPSSAGHTNDISLNAALSSDSTRTTTIETTTGTIPSTSAALSGNPPAVLTSAAAVPASLSSALPLSSGTAVGAVRAVEGSGSSKVGLQFMDSSAAATADTATAKTPILATDSVKVTPEAQQSQNSAGEMQFLDTSSPTHAVDSPNIPDSSVVAAKSAVGAQPQFMDLSRSRRRLTTTTHLRSRAD